MCAHGQQLGVIILISLFCVCAMTYSFANKLHFPRARSLSLCSAFMLLSRVASLSAHNRAVNILCFCTRFTAASRHTLHTRRGDKICSAAAAFTPAIAIAVSLFCCCRRTRRIINRYFVSCSALVLCCRAMLGEMLSSASSARVDAAKLGTGN